MTDREAEDAILAKDPDAPRVTLEDIEAAITNEVYFTAADCYAGKLYAESYMAREFLKKDDGLEPLRRLTFCVLIINGKFTVTGESACIDPGTFDYEIGKQVARQNAIDKCWPLFGFLLANQREDAF